MQKWINLSLPVKMQLTRSGTQAAKDKLESFGYSQIHEKNKVATDWRLQSR
jgi:hypothetical protein